MTANRRPPATLGAAGKRFWRRISAEVDVELCQLDVLEQACLALDRIEDCRQRIDADGPMVDDRFGQRKPHPLLAAERDARSAFRMLYAQMGLTLEPAGEQGRPVED